MDQQYWRTKNLEFHNYEITQSREFPKDAKSLVSFVNDEDRAMGLFGLPEKGFHEIEDIHLIILNRDLDEYDNADLDNLIGKAKNHLTDKSIPLRVHFLNFYDENFQTHLFETFKTHHLFVKPILFDFTSAPSSVIIPVAEVLISHTSRTFTMAYITPETYDIDLIKEIEDTEVNGKIRKYGKLEADETALAIIAGFEDRKAYRMVEEVKPDFGYLFNNIFINEIKELDLAKQIMNSHQDLIELKNFKQFNLPRYDINRIINAFELLHSLHEDRNLIIAPFGSKIQRIAAMLYVSSEPNLAIMDIIPDELSFRKISSGIKDRLYYTIRRKN